MGKWRKSSPELVASFLAYTGELEVEPRKMFGYPCCFLNNNMMTGLHEENWILRLSEEDRESIDAEGFAPMGRRMREYIVIPPTTIDDEEALRALLQKSYDFVKTLPPKVKKSKKSGKR